MKKLNDPDWKVRREGIDNLDGILASNNYRVCLNGLIDLISILKARLIEKNKNLSKGFILFTGKLAESVGKDIKPYAKTLLIPLMSNLSDKQNFIRSDTLASMDRFAEVLGPETIINIGAATYLANESPEMRNELLNWILKYQDCLNKCDLKGLAGVLLNCLIDRNKEVRSSSELLFEKVISIIGLNEFRNKLQDFKPAVVQQLKPIFEKYAAFSKEVEVNASEGQYSMNNKGKNNKDSKVTHSNKGNASNTNINNINTGKKNETTSNFLPIIPLKGIGSEKSFKVYNNNNNNNPSQIDICEQKYPHLPNSDEITKESGFPMIVNSNLTNPAPIQQRIFKPGHLIADSGLGSGLKTKRVIEEMNHPWSNEELYDDLVMELQRNIKNLITEDLNKKLLSLDFRKHIESVEILKKACVSESNNIKEISDLIIKWCFIRVWGNTNSLIIGQILSLIKNLLILLSEKNYPLFDFEANILAGLLKESLNNDPLSKGYINEIHDLIIRIYPEEKLAHCWLEFYQKTNDFRLKENIIEFLIDRIEIFSIEDVPLLGSIPEISRSTSFMNKILRLFTHDVLQAYGFPVNMKQDVSLSNKKYQDFSLMQKNPKELELPIIQKPIESLNNNRQKEIPKITQKEELCEEHKENDIYSVKKIEIQSKTNEIQSKYKLLRERTHELREKANELQPKPFENKEQINYNFNFNQIIVDSSQQNQLNVLNKLNENFSSDNAKPPVSKKPANNTNNITEESFLLMTNNLKEGSITKKIDSLLMINDITISEKDELKLLLKGNADILALTLLEVLKDSFDRAKSTPNQFIHYFLNILHKVVSLKIFIGSVSNSILANFTEEMIVRLLLEDEAKTTVNQNHSYDFVKLLNSIMLRMLENSNLNEIYSILLDLLIKYRRKANSNTKTLALIIKCLWKLTKSFEGSISEINIGMILLKSHEYLSQLDNEVGKQSEDAGVKTIRTILAELVKIVGEGIWEHYMVIRDSGNPDQYIEKS